MLGETKVKLGQFEAGLQHLHRFHSLSRQLLDLANMQRALATLGWAHLTIGQAGERLQETDLKHALSYQQQCLEAASKIPVNDVEPKERHKMKGRALENIGRVNWIMKSRQEAENYFGQARLHFKEHKLFKDLQRLENDRACLVMESCEADSEADAGGLETALELSRAAVAAAQRSGFTDGTVESLATLSRVFILQEQWEDAKETLFKARRLAKENPFVNHNLKMVVVILRCKEELGREETTARQFQGYEGIADALSKFLGTLKEKQIVLRLAVKYYKLAFSSLMNNSSKEKSDRKKLTELNNSIAKSFEDMQEYNSAEEFYRQQLELESGWLEEQCVTLSCLAMLQEMRGAGLEAVLAARHAWLDCAVRSGSREQQIAALQELMRVQQEAGREEETEQTRDKLAELAVGEDKGMGSQASSQGEESFPGVDLDILETEVAAPGQARRTPVEFTKRNAKGEFPLHVEVQQPGREARVLRLLERGHPLECEDNAGWTPLGDAVGNMNISYVEIFVSWGANLDHRNCKGETPLMEACKLGWLDGLELLLAKQAKVELKNKAGRTCLPYLVDHIRAGNGPAPDPDYLRPRVMERLEAARSKIETRLRLLGLPLDSEAGVEEDSPDLGSLADIEMELDTTLTHNPVQGSSSPARREEPASRRRQVRSPEWSPSRSRSRSASPVRRLYQDTIAGLGSRVAGGERGPPARPPSSPGSVPADQELEDWLEDDIGQQRKRKRHPGEKLLIGNKKGRGTGAAGASKENIPQRGRSLLTIPSRKKHSRQPKIFDSLPVISRTPSPAPSPSPPPAPDLGGFTVRVAVEGEVLLVPVPDPALTVGWLAGEAGERFSRQSHGGLRPAGDLQLSTVDGARLDPADSVRAVIQAGALLTARAAAWHSRPVLERYREECGRVSAPAPPDLCSKLATLTSSLVLQAPPPAPAPLFLALRGCPDLKELSLTQCRLTDRALEPLLAALPALPALTSLDLSYNRLTVRSVAGLARLSLPRLSSLWLAGAVLGDFALPDVARLVSTACPGLAGLDLACCNITAAAFLSDGNILSAAFRDSALRSLNFSRNSLGSAGLTALLDGLPPGLTELKLIACSSEPPIHLFPGLASYCQLTCLDLAGLGLTDNSLTALSASCLPSLTKLARLTVSHNSVSAAGLTGLAAGLVSHLTPLTALHCRLARPSEFWPDSAQFLCEGLESSLEQLLGRPGQDRLQQLSLPSHPRHTGALAALWEAAWPGTAHHTRDGFGNVEFTVSQTV